MSNLNLHPNFESVDISILASDSEPFGAENLVVAEAIRLVYGQVLNWQWEFINEMLVDDWERQMALTSEELAAELRERLAEPLERYELGGGENDHPKVAWDLVHDLVGTVCRGDHGQCVYWLIAQDDEGGDLMARWRAHKA